MNPRAEPRDRIGGVILAGGASRRMSGPPKAFRDLGGRPLIDHVIQRMKPQVNTLVLSVARQDPAWECFGLQQVADGSPENMPPGDTRGPLAGLLSGMEALCDRHEWILVAPCDAPFLPENLGQQLLEAARIGRTKAGVATYEGVPQSTFSVWNCALLRELQQAVRVEGLGGFKQFLVKVPFTEYAWAHSVIPPFFNVNTIEELAAAESLIGPSRELR